MTRIARFGKIVAALTMLAALAGCIVEPAYYGPPRHYWGGYYR